MRLDIYLTHNNQVKSRSEATDLIKQGLVLVNDKVVTKAGLIINDQDQVVVLQNRMFVSRAGEKLLQALNTFNIDLRDQVIIDIGSSTGGFVDCCLKNGAKQVYAYDVGTNQLHESLRNHPQIVLKENTNILDVDLPDNDYILIDVSFTSIKPIIKHILPKLSLAICLLKPQFETVAANLKKGVVKNQKVISQIMKDFTQFINDHQLKVIGFVPTKLKGKDGNQEYLFYLTRR